MLSKKKIILISGILKGIPNLACAYLHGSALTEYFRRQSDIDIALLFLPGTKISLLNIIRDYNGRMDSLTNHTAHFGILSSKNVVFAKEVILKGELIVCNDSYFCKSFTMHTLSMYTALNIERSKILEQYAA
ncbi:MAG: nucleotidyltransferase domain-containing protein [Desulfobacula sp.]|uniref:type VII toxin-antitoxin system MntA family adenylyltransferase antitoxin n=1 Tax=Desulfobacula sp. TaxID=2593537 RepID=UPI0025BB6585|nr:nucleotidyltransferase domain-containing protein [Desulfobacula sp.]MCD4722153.1 nucleotidyltransferase domain-containing protein [Desulfobacula sp.]